MMLARASLLLGAASARSLPPAFVVGLGSSRSRTFSRTRSVAVGAEAGAGAGGGQDAEHVSSSSTHVSLAPYFTVPEGRMDEFTATFPAFYDKTKAGTLGSGDCLYYSLAVDAVNNLVVCREGYKNAEGILSHLGEVEAELETALGIVGEGGLDLSVFGPAEELAKLREPLGPLGTKFFELNAGSMSFMADDGALTEDTHVCLAPYFTVPPGKMDEFKATFPGFTEKTRLGTGASGDCLYYGFAVNEGDETEGETSTVLCREGYKNAEGVLAHLGEVEAELDVALGIVGEGGLELHVMGPAEELEKLREPLGPLGTKFFELGAGGMSRMV